MLHRISYLGQALKVAAMPFVQLIPPSPYQLRRRRASVRLCAASSVLFFFGKEEVYIPCWVLKHSVAPPIGCFGALV